MDVPHRLSAHLADLSGTLDEAGADLQAMLTVLVDDLVTAVPSFLGLTMTIPTDGREITLSLLPPELAGAVRTSLLLPLAALGNGGSDGEAASDGEAGHDGEGGHGGTIVFFAARPGSFFDLAADTRFAFGLDGQVKLDEHLPSLDNPVALSGVFGHTETSIINQAVGVRLGRGHTIQSARGVLQRRADQAGVSLHDVARQLLDTVAGRPGPPPLNPQC